MRSGGGYTDLAEQFVFVRERAESREQRAENSSVSTIIAFVMLGASRFL